MRRRFQSSFCKLKARKDMAGYEPIGGALEAEGAARSTAWSDRWTRVRLLSLLVLVAFCLGLAALSRLRWSSSSSSVRLIENEEGGREFELVASPESVEDGGELKVMWVGRPSKYELHNRDYVTLSCGDVNGDEDYLLRADVGDRNSRSVVFTELVMMRCNYVAKYFNYRGDGYTAIGSIEVPMREPFSSPKHGHLSLTTGESDMAVMFNSASSRTPRVQYGLDPEQLHHESLGTSTTYSASDMCQPPASITAQHLFRDPGFMHTVILRGLDPDQVYFYKYGNDIDGWSKVERFRSRPHASSMSAKIIAFGDLGVYPAPASETTVARMYKDVTTGGFDSFLLHFGDISYAFGDGSIWDRFFHLIEPVATKIPYMVSIGNHEYCYTAGGERDPSGGAEPSGGSFSPTWGNYANDSNGECGVPMHYRWHAPATGNWIYWYSFNYGGIHVVQMSTEHDWTRGSEQFEWLARDLASVDRNVTPWIILTAHRMMYSTQPGNDAEMVVGNHFRDHIEDLLYKNRVNLVLVGHQHSYERSCPVYKGECIDSGAAPVHMVVGTAGYPLNTVDFSTQYGNWSLKHVNAYGYLRISSTQESMQVEFVLNQDGSVFDDFTISSWS